MASLEKMRHRRPFSRLRGWLRQEQGQGLVEYGLLMMLIVIAAIASVTLLGSTIYEAFWETGLANLGS